jgi:uronate dehydrogenase
MSVSKVLITGAGGRLGGALRERLRGRFPLLRLSDTAPMKRAGPGEEVVPCDLGDYHAVKALCRGVDAVIHLGAEARETCWPRLTAGNLTGTINVYEGARKAKVDRVLFASSITAVGFYRVNVTLDHTSPPRPDGRYSTTKAFGENLAMMYAYKHAIRSFVMRLGACRPRPTESIHLPIWLSYDDLARLVVVGLTADYRFEVVYGLSRSRNCSFDNCNAFRLGYQPLDNSDDYSHEVPQSAAHSEVAAAFQGPFASLSFTGDIDWAP